MNKATANSMPAGDQPVPARCPDCQEMGGCRLGIRAAFRIPQDGCLATGISRTAIYYATSPTEENQFNPPVQSYEIRKAGAKSGVRVVDGRSWCNYVRSQPPSPKVAKKSKAKRTKTPRTKTAPKNPANVPAAVTTAVPPSADTTPTISAAPPVPGNGPVSPPPPPPPPEESSTQEAQP
jgi:hypothetical protein